MSDQEKDSDKDNIPMLSKNVELKRFTMRSASMSIPSDETFSNPSFISHTGPLQMQKPPQFVPMSGPLRSFKRKDNLPPSYPHGNQSNDIPSTSVTVMAEELGRSDRYHDHVKQNDHLLKSGPLGLCNDPDCTECPAAYKKSKRSSFYRSYASLDSKVPHLFTDLFIS
jgi:cyclic nucleotide gated channel, plant